MAKQELEPTTPQPTVEEMIAKAVAAGEDAAAKRYEPILAEQNAKIAALEAKANVVPEQNEPGKRYVDESEIKKFLASKRPDNEFFVTNWRHKVMVRDSTTRYNRETGMEETTPMVVVDFDEWFGPGSELKDKDDKPLFPRGLGHRVISREGWPELSRITDLDEDGIQQIINRIHALNGVNTEESQIIPGELLRLQLQKEYDLRAASRKLDNEFAQEKAKIHAGIASGHPRFGIKQTDKQ